MARLDAERYAQIRAGVEDGRIRVGSLAHLDIIQSDLDLSATSRRDRQIITLAIRGWTHVRIAQKVGLSRGRVSYILRDFFGG